MTYHQQHTTIKTSDDISINKDIIILAIESSCDDTSAAIMRNGILLSNITASQAVHEAYGGGGTAFDSRGPQPKIVSVCKQAPTPRTEKKDKLSPIPVTKGPGIMG